MDGATTLDPRSPSFAMLHDPCKDFFMVQRTVLQKVMLVLLCLENLLVPQFPYFGFTLNTRSNGNTSAQLPVTGGCPQAVSEIAPQNPECRRGIPASFQF